MRIKGTCHDLCLLTFYLPPCRGDPTSKAATRAVCDWVRRLLRGLPKRTTVLWGADANARMGLAEGQDSLYPHVGAHAPEREDFNGTRLRECLVDGDLVAANTHSQVGSTYWGSKDSSRIDYVGCSLAVFNRSGCSPVDCHLLRKSGTRLQCIRGISVPFGCPWRPRDHRPLQMLCDPRLVYDTPP